MYTHGHETYDSIVSMGCNMVVSGPAWETDLVRARALGLRVIPSWYGDDDTAARLMASLDTDPIVMAWYPFDEPDIYGYSSGVVAEKIGRLRTYSPSKPVYLTVFNSAAYAAYLPHADLIGITPYPIGRDATEVRMSIVGRYARRARALSGGKPVYVCIPTFFQRPWQYREPGEDELHNIVYQALTGSPDGIIYFIWTIGGMDGVIWNLGERPALLAQITRLNAELKDLDTALVRSVEEPGAVTSPLAVYHRVARHDGGVTWFAANPGNGPETAVLRLPRGAAAVSIVHGRGARLGEPGPEGTVTLHLDRLGCAAVRIEDSPGGR